MPTHFIRTPSTSPLFRGAPAWLTRASRRAGVLLLATGFIAGCALPKHPDTSAPPTDPYNPAATQLLDDTQWQLTRWTDASGKPRALPQDAGGAQPITLDFSTASGHRRASGFSGCNRFAGAYDLKDGKLTFGPLAGTRMACVSGTGGALEQPYLDGLAHVARSGVQMNPPPALQLTLADGQVLTFAPRPK
ncbi:META domain-containing protein [Caballeronia sp. GAFFF2]|uniref:META domain-containing protein n=1 Tax=Caballeronia sp. GAFFF2 TaxID=2921741 RepID=UPI002028BF18|nr:META domain-containing protein [Caballeronia sp. GAFFF2]